MPSARQQALRAIKVGDVIYGISGNGNEKLLLVYEVNETGFLARHITTNTSAEFGRDGNAKPVAGSGTCTIASIAPLLPAIHRVAIGLDRKVRT